MDNQDYQQTLLSFFKALSEPNRLKIIGLLAQESHTVEQLARLLGISVSTTSNHLGVLSHAGLVEARPKGHYYYYSLNTNHLREMAKTLLSEENLPKLALDENQPEYEKRVLMAFTDTEGRIKTFPAQEKKLLVLLHYVVNSFQVGDRYTEKQVNEILLRYNVDTAYLRRSLIEYKLMAREGGGGEYWRI
jgi:DNA-binding transcriptional ArsR family regulator